MTANPSLGLVSVKHSSSYEFNRQNRISNQLIGAHTGEDNQSEAIRGLIQGLSECQVLCTQWHATRLGVAIKHIKVEAQAKIRKSRVDSIHLDVHIEASEDVPTSDIVEVFEEARRYSPLQSCVRSQANVDFGTTFQSLGSLPDSMCSAKPSLEHTRTVRGIQDISFDMSCSLDSRDGSKETECRPDTMMSSLADSLKASLALRSGDGQSFAAITQLELDFEATADMHPVLSDIKQGDPTRIVATAKVKGYGTEEELQKEWERVKTSSPVLASIQSPTPIRYSLYVNGVDVDHFTAENTFAVEL